MADYEHKDVAEVQRLAKQGDKDALYEMAWRIELLPAADRNNPVETCAWQDYWLEKAADAGNIEAKGCYARSLVNRIGNAEDRNKALGYFQSLVDDFEAGKITDKEEGEIAYLYLGMLLCEGYFTPRDAVKGAECLRNAEKLSGGFKGYGFPIMDEIATIYGQGLAQPDEEPTLEDLDTAARYFDIAISRFNPERNNPRILEEAKRYRDAISGRKEEKSRLSYTKISRREIDERREKMTQITSPEARRRLEDDKAALRRLREKLAREGW